MVLPSATSILTSITFPTLIVPRNTRSPGHFLIGLDSPVTELSSNSDCPDATVPSIGGVEPLGTRTISPISKKSAETFCTLEPGFDNWTVVSVVASPFSMSPSMWRKLPSSLFSSDKPTRSASAGFKLDKLVMASPVRLLLYASRYLPGPRVRCVVRYVNHVVAYR